MAQVKKTADTMSTPKNNLYLIAVAIALLVGAFIFFNPPQRDKTVNNPEFTGSTASSTIEEASKPKTIAYRGQAGKTALELLKNAATIETQGEGTNAFVTSINGYKPDINKEFWSLFINGKPSEVGAGTYVTRSDDLIEWKLEEIK